MISATSISNCVRQYVDDNVASLEPQQWEEWLLNPSQAWINNEKAFIAKLEAVVDLTELAAHIRTQPLLHLKEVFATAGLPQTPTGWVPIPTGAETRAALSAVILLAGACGMEVVSYGSENDGALFVNLVTLPGTGAIVEKSQSSMKGHTDAATFPFRSTTDPDFPKIAPSPDIVFLVGLRNPEGVPTVLMPLPDILAKLDKADIQLLKEPNLVLSAQRTFVQGTRHALGEAHLLDGAAVLFDGPEGTWVRYTHSQSWVYDESNLAVIAAKNNFEAACVASAQQIVLQPGELLLINNRKALHGRAKVGPEVGGNARWLVRSYGLDCSQVTSAQRYQDSSFKLYP